MRHYNTFLRSRNKTAFSLLELSIVIVIIGVLIVGVIGGKHIIKKSRISTAQSLTSSSPISGINDNQLWLETSLDVKAFTDGNALSNGDYIENWNDNSYNQNKPLITKVGLGPTYSNSINHIQAVRFDETSEENYLEINDASFLNGTDYTIFVLEKRLSDKTNNYFIGDGSVTTDNETLILGYNSNSSIIHSQGDSNNYNATIETYGSYSNKPRLFTFTHSNIDGNKTYINGVLAGEDETATTHLSNITNLAIGKDYNGEIAEIAIFTRDLKQVEIIDIENYLAKKYNAPNNREQVSQCTNGTITSEGCIQQCQVNVIGSSDTTPKDDNTTGSIVCNETGYDNTDTIAYNCQNGVTITGTCGCDSANGYILENGVCQQLNSCDNLNITGSTTTSISHNESTDISCDETGYAGTISDYSCNNGTFTLNGSCDCDVANNYISDGNGGCEISSPFISTWNTTNTSSGSSASNQIKLPLFSTGTYDFVVDWGDGNTDTITAWDQTETTHTYASSGVKTLTITGTITGWRFNNTGDRLKMTNISQWGTFRLGINEGRYFWGASNLTITANDALDLTGTTSLERTFWNCSSITTIPNLSNWNTSSITNFIGVFSGASSFNQTFTWNFSNATSLRDMFSTATSFNGNITGWDVSTITDFWAVFNAAGSFNQNLASWDISNATIMNFMLNGTGLSRDNYNNILIGWEAQGVQDNVTFSAGSTKYNSSASAARARLISDHNWTITDGGLAP